jgi:chromosome segregation ATPase
MSDKAPIGNTCPTIDSIVSKMEYAKGEAEYINKHKDEDPTQEANTIISELQDAINDMENIRDDNAELRQWGNDEYERAENLESERDDALRDKENLEYEVDELKEKIAELELELDQIPL